jgi:hypothetical protein
MRRRPRFSSASLDALLDGDCDDGTALARVLIAAGAPGTPQELAGLDAARAAFVRAAPAPSRPPMTPLSAATRTAAGRLLAVKAIAAVSGATLIGGVAYAATSTHLLGGRSPHHRQQQPAPTSGSGLASWDPAAHRSGGRQQPTTVRQSRAYRSTDHPQPGRATTPEKGHENRATPSAHASHNPPNAPPPSSRTHRPSSTPTTAPATTGHARTTPPQVPTDPGANATPPPHP